MPSRRKRKRERRLAEATAQQPGFCGGWGQNLELRPADLLLVRKAIKEHWPIPQETRDSVVADVTRMLDAPGLKSRRYVSTVRCVLAMVEDNQRTTFAALDELGPLTAAECAEALDGIGGLHPWGTG